MCGQLACNLWLHRCCHEKTRLLQSLCYQCTIVSANFAAGIRLRRPVRVCEVHSHVSRGCSGDAVAKTRSLQLPWVHKRSQAPQTHSPYTAMPTCVQSASAQVLRWPKIFIRICHVTTFAWSYTTASSNCTANTWLRRLTANLQ